jgi:hypothetical protein
MQKTIKKVNMEINKKILPKKVAVILTESEILNILNRFSVGVLSDTLDDNDKNLASKLNFALREFKGGVESKSESFNDWVEEMDKVLSETRNLTVDGQPMERSDLHFNQQSTKLAKIPLVLDDQAVYPLNEWTTSDLIQSEIDAKNNIDMESENV